MSWPAEEVSAGPGLQLSGVDDAVQDVPQAGRHEVRDDLSNAIND